MGMMMAALAVIGMAGLGWRWKRSRLQAERAMIRREQICLVARALADLRARRER